MPTLQALIDQAFSRLAEQPGFVDRPDQRQLALLIGDSLEVGSSGAFEAPTGLGKSLAALVPAIAAAMALGKRTVIATYTNVLAEQYWRKDLPLASSLFEDDLPRTQFLIGRQRYACLAEIEGLKQETDSLFAAGNKAVLSATSNFRRQASQGIETEFRLLAGLPPRELSRAWPRIAAPPVCPARLCPHYHDCYYYRARRGAERAEIVITNHSVVLQDAQLRHASEGEMSLLGDYDFLVIDEAHDFPQAAANAMEFELNESRLAVLIGLAGKIEQAIEPIAPQAGLVQEWRGLCDDFRQSIARLQTSVREYGGKVGGAGILAASPERLLQHPQVQAICTRQALDQAKDLSAEAAFACNGFSKDIARLLKRWDDEDLIDSEKIIEAKDAVKNYTLFLREFAQGCQWLFQPQGVSVSYANEHSGMTTLRHDTIDLSGPLREILWSRTPTVCMSATLALDQNFEFFRRQTGFEPEFEEVLPSPFDFSSQAAVYLPPGGAVPDPSIARKEGTEDAYFDAIARQLVEIIRICGGRTLALFHSRREMEAAYLRVKAALPEAPIFLQRATGVASVGERFKSESRSSLFAVRSFWTGFDAPGDTLSCVALVRIPFDVPVDPPQVARMAWLQSIGVEPFSGYSLPNAKMMMRQGAGRLIRCASDRGVIALLDPRLTSKRYGEEILANLPSGMRTFREMEEAAAHAGILTEDVSISMVE